MVTRGHPGLALARRLGHKASMVERGRSVQQRLREFQGQLRQMLPLVEELLEAGKVQEREAVYTAAQEKHGARPADSRFRIEHYGKTPHFALYDGTDLVAVMAYKRGAVEVKRRLETLEQEIARLNHALAEVGGEPPKEARRVRAVERLQAAREAGNVRTR